jgi:TetR/AcrR family transcriptional repressor of lmrAB and yxaGH operons
MVTAAARLFRAQGYPATGWRQVVTESAAPWGSQAHHFPGGKEQLGVEALSWAATGFERAIRTVFAGVHPADAVHRWVHTAAAELAASNWRDGCPVATVTLETAHSSGAPTPRRWAAGVPPSPTRWAPEDYPRRRHGHWPPSSWPASRAG